MQIGFIIVSVLFLSCSQGYSQQEILGEDLRKTEVFHVSFDGTIHPLTPRHQNEELIEFVGGSCRVADRYSDGRTTDKKSLHCSTENRVFVHYNAKSLFCPEKGTVACWVKPEWDAWKEMPSRKYSTKYQHIFGAYDESRKNGIILYRQKGVLYFSVQNSAAMSTIQVPISRKDAADIGLRWEKDQWHFLVCTWSKKKTRISLYIDGKKYGERECLEFPIRIDDLFIGSAYYRQCSFDGCISDFSIYSEHFENEAVQELWKIALSSKDGGNETAVPVDTNMADGVGNQNILKNGSFEYDLTYWNIYSFRDAAYRWFLDSSTSYVGNQSLQIAGTDAQPKKGVARIRHFMVKLEPGQVYTLSAYMKGRCKEKASLSFFENWKVLKKDIELTREWKRYFITAEIPDDWCPFIIPRIIVSVEKGEAVWIDGVRLEEGKLTPLEREGVDFGVYSDKPASTFLVGEPIDLRVKIVGKSTVKRELMLSYVIQNVFGRVLEKGEKRLTICSDEESHIFNLPIRISEKGLFIGHFCLMIDDRQIMRKSTRFAIIQGLTADQDRVFGGSHFSVLDLSDQQWNESLSVWPKFGVHLIREMVPERIKSDPEDLHALIQPENILANRVLEARRNHIEFVFCLRGFRGVVEKMRKDPLLSKKIAPSKGTTDRYFSDSVYEAWGEWVNQIVSFYKDKVKYYEIMNEPEGWSDPAFAGRNLPPTVYVRILKTAYEAAKKADPECIIAGCGIMSLEHIDWVEEAFKAGAGKYLDVVTFHAYQESPRKPDYGEKIKYLKHFVVDKYGSNQRLWQTEQMWWRHHEPEFGAVFNRVNPLKSFVAFDYVLDKKEVQQAAYYAQMLIMSRFFGVEQYIWHELMSYDGRTHTGALDARRTPALIAIVMNNAMFSLKDTDPFVEFSRESYIKACVFKRRTKGFLICIWIQNERTEDVTIRTPNGLSNMIVRDMAGGVVEPKIIDNRMVLPLSSAPLFWHIEGPFSALQSVLKQFNLETSIAN